MRILTSEEIRQPETRDWVVTYLLREETTHCLFLQNRALTGRGSVPWPRTDHSWAAERAGEIIAVAAWMPPHNLLLSTVADVTAIPALVAAIQDQETLPLGLHAPDRVAARFADEWCRHLLLTQRVAMRQRVYELDHVYQPATVAGTARLATDEDRDTLIRLAGEFAAESLTDEEKQSLDVARFVDGRFTAPNWWMVWEHGDEIVSIASANGETPHAMRIGPVYTPPEHRRHGYASALTAAVARRILDKGHARAMLFTDLANPTSNNIYQAIGFRPVADFSLIGFGPAGSAE